MQNKTLGGLVVLGMVGASAQDSAAGALCATVSALLRSLHCDQGTPRVSMRKQESAGAKSQVSVAPTFAAPLQLKEASCNDGLFAYI